MAGTLVWVGIFLAALAVLVKAAGYFTDAAETIGLYYGLPPFIVGVTIVATGTSLPELVSSIVAVLQNTSEIVPGNVVGSNIANILFILGVAAVVGKKLQTSRDLIRVDLPILIASAFLLGAALWDGVFSIFESLIFLAGLGTYIYFTISEKEETAAEDVLIEEEVYEEVQERQELGWKPWAMLLGSIVFIYLGARYTVESIIHLSQVLQIGAEVIATSAVAFGTSLPEIMVTISAVRRGKGDLAIGNILGSNIFNTYAVMSIPAFVGTITIPASILQYSLPIMIMATLLYFFITQDKEINKWEGGTLLLFYVLFIGNLFLL